MFCEMIASYLISACSKHIRLSNNQEVCGMATKLLTNCPEVKASPAYWIRLLTSIPLLKQSVLFKLRSKNDFRNDVKNILLEHLKTSFVRLNGYVESHRQFGLTLCTDIERQINRLFECVWDCCRNYEFNIAIVIIWLIYSPSFSNIRFEREKWTHIWRCYVHA